MKKTSQYSIRAARKTDLIEIRTLIRSARINILGLDWRRFCVAVDQDDQVIGCGQIKQHKDGSRELASIVVHEAWQGKGVSRAIIENLIGGEDQDLWLMCRSGLVPFYERFGFKEIIEPLDMPPYFGRIKRLWFIVTKATKGQRMLSVMLRKSEAFGTSPELDGI
jgi:N-acetylglutamate synthase-like GNAT family acetyltransferase